MTLASDAAPVDDALRRAADRFIGDLLDAPADTHAALLRDLRATDPALFALVSSLTAHLDEIDDFLAVPRRPLASPPAPEPEVGTQIGHWRVVRSIGRGGMGLVFEVERADGVVQQRAALKLIKGGLDDETLASRFRTERQILAGLEHPSIGRLIDAGTSSEGRAYLVMEFVDGVPLDAWCAQRALTVEQRIALFTEVCDAVHYAHQRLVVHRDLKPNNILVTADGTPKLVDFGISKMLEVDATSAQTIDSSTLLTPRYASPEQLRGTPISTASDVYSLTVVLFELLTGDTPYRTAHGTLIETMQAVVHEEPARASTVAERMGAPGTARRLRGDLDAILAKGLAKEPAERYESVAALRDDLARHLAGDPITATPSKWAYRADKFVRKHRAAVASAAFLTLAILATSAVAIVEAYRAERARESAERRFDETRSLAKAMLFDVNDAIATGPTKAREQLIRTAVTYLDGLSKERLLPDLQRDVAAGYERIGEILGDQTTDNLGRTEEGKGYLLKALAMREALARAEPRNRDNLTGLSNVNANLGYLTRYSGDAHEAARYFAASGRAAADLLALDPNDSAAFIKTIARRRDEALILYAPGRPNLHRYDESLARYQALLVDLDAYAASHPAVAIPAQTYQTLLADLAGLQRLAGDARSALATSERNLAIVEAAIRAEPTNPRVLSWQGLIERRIGDSLLELGRPDEGFAMLERSLAHRQQRYDADPSSERAARDLAIGHSMMAFAYDLAGRPREAADEYRVWADQAEAALKREPTNVGHRLDLAQARWSIADMHLAMGRTAQALAEARQVEADVLAFDEKTRTQDAAREALGRARLVEARGLALGGSRDDAFTIAKAGLRELDANVTATPEDAFAIRDAARARVQAGEIAYASPGQRAEGCALIVEGREALRALRARDRLTAQFDSVLAHADVVAARCGTRGTH